MAGAAGVAGASASASAGAAGAGAGAAAAGAAVAAGAAALFPLGFFFCAYAACGSSIKAAASRSHLRACFIATPSAPFEALADRSPFEDGTTHDDDASCLNCHNCWGIRLTAKVSATISCAISTEQWIFARRIRVPRESSRTVSAKLSAKGSRSLGAKKAIAWPRVLHDGRIVLATIEKPYGLTRQPPLPPFRTKLPQSLPRETLASPRHARRGPHNAPEPSARRRCRGQCRPWPFHRAW